MAAFRSILIALDPADPAPASVAHGIDLARQAGASLKVVAVIEPTPHFEQTAAPDAEASREVRRHEVVRALESLSGLVRSSGIEVATRVLSGRSEIEIPWEVIRGGHDLIVLAHGTKDGRTDPTSLSLDLVRLSPCAVLIVRHPARPSFRRILAAIDPDPGDPLKVSLNGRILRVATELSRARGADCLAVHAWAPHDAKAMWRRLGPRDFQRHDACLRRATEEAMRQTLLPFRAGIPESATVIARGLPGDVIPRLARQRSADLVVLGTVARKSLQGLVTGNTTEVVLRRSRCAVLTLKPEGFRSPLCA